MVWPTEEEDINREWGSAFEYLLTKSIEAQFF